MVHALKTGQSDLVKIPLLTNNQESYVVYFYKVVHDQAGNYASVNEWSVDIMPLINWYLHQIEQKLVPSESGYGCSDRSLIIDCEVSLLILMIYQIVLPGLLLIWMNKLFLIK